MTKALIVHIGDHTTGSARLQRCLAGGHARADEFKLFYPQVFGSELHHNRAAHALHAADPKDSETTCFKLLQPIRDGDADMAVISAEALEFADPADVRDVLESHMRWLGKQARIVAYVRPHAERFLIGYEQQLRLGLFFGDLQAFFDMTRADGRFLYHTRFERWKAVFGDRLTVRPLLPDHLVGGEMLSDFLDMVFEGRDYTLSDLPPTIERHDLAQHEIAMICALQGRLRGVMPRSAAHVLGGYASRLLTELHDDTAPGLALPPALAEQIVSTYAEDAQAMDRDFFADTPLSTALDALRHQPGSADWPDMETAAQFDPETARLVGVWADLVAEIYKDMPDKWGRHLFAPQFSFPRPPAPQTPEEMEAQRAQDAAGATGPDTDPDKGPETEAGLTPPATPAEDA
ncbi:hypothetical protein [Thalassococcus sp. S3]|uniref:hypothetical protein n=1 Tax=Thalassococcus sp. S3 TaxID=2017482 RepID=UPI00102400B3|nr:hypothetical protein [Thalassococcus sp. S3]QBF34248.1 hypothetical protein CFI11_23980 [Thalassococcus sp. S3]